MSAGHRIGKDGPKFPQVLRVRYALLVHLLDHRVDDAGHQELLAYAHQLARPCDGGARITQFGELLRNLENLDELVEFADRDAEDVGRARAPHQIDEAIRDHLLFLSFPFLPLAMNVNPYPQPFLLCEGSVCHLNGNLAILLPPSFDQKARVCPPPVTINDAELALDFRMWLDKE